MNICRSTPMEEPPSVEALSSTGRNQKRHIYRRDAGGSQTCFFSRVWLWYDIILLQVFCVVHQREIHLLQKTVSFCPHDNYWDTTSNHLYSTYWISHPMSPKRNRASPLISQMNNFHLFCTCFKANLKSCFLSKGLYIDPGIKELNELFKPPERGKTDWLGRYFYLSKQNTVDRGTIMFPLEHSNENETTVYCFLFFFKRLLSKNVGYPSGRN